MNAPIPEPVALEQPALVRGPRPWWLIVLCALELAVTAAQCIDNPTPFKLVFSACWLAVLSCLWCGYNWARIVVIISGVLTLTAITELFTNSTSLQQVVTVVNVLTSVGWLSTLFRREAAAFTQGVPVPDGASTPPL